MGKIFFPFYPEMGKNKKFFPLQPEMDFSQNDKCLFHIKDDMGRKKRAQDRSGNVMVKPEKIVVLKVFLVYFSLQYDDEYLVPI